ncbi:MAG: hypothetical protein E7208_12770 [Clostridium butyricum]|nr:hypothetical protein [Clostridium butyricum]
MKKILRISIIITVIIMLVGCSSTNKPAYNEVTHNVNDETDENNSLSDKQPKSQSKDTSTNIKDTDSSLLESIDITESQFEKGYYDYKGTINNNIPIRMSIYQLEKDIVGTYYYKQYGNEIRLKGKSGKEKIVLYEYDESGKNTGIFQGTMSTVDKIDGTWISSDGKTSYPFVLSLDSIINGVEYGKRYSVAADNKSDQDIENFFSKIQSYIVNDNKVQLAEEINYPINVKINGELMEIKNKDDLIKNYDQIFYADYKQLISNSDTKYLFVNYQGIMLGSGYIWANNVHSGSNSKLMITAINN